MKNFDSKKREVIELMFIKLSAIYGNAWRNLYKNTNFLSFAKEEWFDALSAFTEDVIHRAISICTEHNKFPPSLPEVIISCSKSFNRNNSFFQLEAHKKGNQEPAKFQFKKEAATYRNKSALPFQILSIDSIQQILEKKQPSINMPASVKTQFHPKIIISNQLGLLLAKYIESYDQLVATLKILCLSDCFNANSSYFNCIKQAQKKSNAKQLISRILKRKNIYYDNA